MVGLVPMGLAEGFARGKVEGDVLTGGVTELGATDDGS
jgi:hypothetical protein